MPEVVAEVFRHEQLGAAPPARVDYVIATPSPRFAVIHYHILKNAGSTIEFILRREFGEKFASLHGSHADAILTSKQAADFLVQYPEIRALSSHHLTYPLPNPPGMVVFDVCFLRDPLERLGSFYRHLRRSADQDELSDLARRADLSSFLEVLIRDHPHLVNDVQVNRLANGGKYTRPPNPSDLAKAATIVRQVSVLGVVELFDKSCVAAEYALAPAFPGFQMHYVPQNVSRFRSTHSRSFREAAGKLVYRYLSQMNRLDYELCQCARNEVSRRFRLVPDSDQRLREFCGRSAVLG